VRRGSSLLFVAVVALVGWTLYSYWSSGFVFVLFSGSPDDGPWLDRVRETVAGWGRWAPLVYTLAVVAEVIVAPIPGTLLYAPAGAIFGGFVGGTLSLAGNVIGAAICCVIGRMIGDRMLAVRVDESQLARYRALLERRGLWLVLLLRLNPLTTSDLVSYGAGVAGVPPWKVALGTLFGLAPWCYAQAYFAERIFEVVPGRWLILSGVLLLAALAAALVLRRGGDHAGTRNSRPSPSAPSRGRRRRRGARGGARRQR
jgi:uncharacterized membrane protein YdjX (TVP38/TMEM64 family)